MPQDVQGITGIYAFDAHPSFSRPTDWQVWIDFDGTITLKDVLDELILAFACDDSWRAVEAQWQAEQIGSYDCLRQEFDVLRVMPAQLDEFLKRIPIDPGAAGLFAMLARHEVPATVLSDGIESFIELILKRAEIDSVPIRANRIEQVQDRLTLCTPYRSMNCRSAAAHCKCASAEALAQPQRRSIYIGDGRSDLCPARTVDVVFAKNALARLLTAEGRSFIPFDTLADVASVLSAAWAPAACAS